MSEEAKRVLLVEDEKAVRNAIRAYLERENYVVIPVADGQAAVNAFEQEDPDLVILDLILPKLSGERVCRIIRENSDTPIIMLTSKSKVEDRVRGLDLGADDYLTKPFSPRELMARIRTIFRRIQNIENRTRERLDYGDIIIDLLGQKVIVRGKEKDLTASEFKLLVTLAERPGRIFSRIELIERVLGCDFEGYERTIDSHVKNLRSKIGDSSLKPYWIHTVYGVGYRFDPHKEGPRALRSEQYQNSNRAFRGRLRLKEAPY